MGGLVGGIAESVFPGSEHVDHFGGEISSGPTGMEIQAQQNQRDFIQEMMTSARQQRHFSSVLIPQALKEAGYAPEYDEEGNLTGIKEISSPEERQISELEQAIELGFLNRTQAALKGELPENPALLRDLKDQEEALRDRLRKQLGSGYETSSPGIEALSSNTEDRNIALEQSRRDDLTLSEQLGIARGTYNRQGTQLGLNNLASLAGFQNNANQSIFGASQQGNQFLNALSASRGITSQTALGERGQNLDMAQFGFSLGGLLG